MSSCGPEIKWAHFGRCSIRDGDKAIRCILLIALNCQMRQVIGTNMRSVVFVRHERVSNHIITFHARRDIHWIHTHSQSDDISFSHACRKQTDTTAPHTMCTYSIKVVHSFTYLIWFDSRLLSFYIHQVCTKINIFFSCWIYPAAKWIKCYGLRRLFIELKQKCRNTKTEEKKHVDRKYVGIVYRLPNQYSCDSIAVFHRKLSCMKNSLEIDEARKMNARKTN